MNQPNSHFHTFDLPFSNNLPKPSTSSKGSMGYAVDEAGVAERDESTLLGDRRSDDEVRRRRFEVP